MLPFVISIIFIIQIILVLAVINLTLRQNRILETEKSQERAVRELEETMASFIVEMKEENDKFIQQLTLVKRREPVVNREEEVESRKNDASLNSLPTELISKRQATSAYKNNIENQKPPTLTFEEKVEKLHSEGHSAAAIAKLFNKGTTEIELLLKFRQKEQ
ncbi:hypothetical protein [Mangrovibacillus cuniculi]|uniref:Swarming motility protein SwrB n=1 Tax=Mangrovibacillus cuniculi TaxID=2593652 RepID=A0A7S8HFC5_9BACI|nr:hypothetical protein [Mangrovibacillus cuniculi]QPC46371.1 hypothetical protein G8O30_05020 [Mangrovibacillus cuniculi]